MFGLRRKGDPQQSTPSTVFLAVDRVGVMVDDLEQLERLLTRLLLCLGLRDRARW